MCNRIDLEMCIALRFQNFIVPCFRYPLRLDRRVIQVPTTTLLLDHRCFSHFRQNLHQVHHIHTEFRVGMHFHFNQVLH